MIYFFSHNKKNFMPRKKKSSRRRGRSTTTVNVPRGQLVPDQYACNLVYADSYSISSGTINGEQLWRCNSLFDPDQSGAGHQPLGFDQMTTFYNRYLVKACKIEIAVTNRGSAGVSWIIVPTNDVTGFSGDWDQALEQNRSCKIITSDAEGSGIATRKLTKWFSMRGITGVTKSKYNSDDRYAAIMTADPAEAIGLQWVARASDAATNVTCDLQVRLTFNAVFYDRKVLAQS